MNYKALDEALEYIEEGFFTPNPKKLLDKLEALVDKMESDENAANYSWRKVKKLTDALDKAKLDPEQQKRYKDLKVRLDKIEKQLLKKHALKEIKDAKDMWDNCTNSGCFEGYNVTVLYLLGVSQSDVARHFDKMQGKMHHTVETFVKWMYGDDEADEYYWGTAKKKLSKIVDLKAKAVEIQSNDDNILIYVPSVKKFIDIDTEPGVNIATNIYKTMYLRYLDDDFSIEKAAYIETAKENHIEFKV